MSKTTKRPGRACAWRQGSVAVALVFAACASFAEFKAGFARVDATPPLGIPITGYFHKRIADGVLDPLYIDCVAVSDGTNNALVYCVDALSLSNPFVKKAFPAITAATGVPRDRIYLHATHTHTGPADSERKSFTKEENRLVTLYSDMRAAKLADAGRLAIADMAPAQIGVARTFCRNVSFIRRYRMKDGSVRTNPGVNNPNVKEPLGTPDETLQLVRFRRTGAPDIAIVNFGTHPDTIGGTKFSADWPGVVRRTFEDAVGDGVKCMFLNGAQGDVNHHYYQPPPGQVALKAERGTRRNAVALHMGRAVAGAALSVWDVCEAIPAGPVRGLVAGHAMPANRPTADELKWVEMFDAGRKKDIPLGSMEIMTLTSPGSRVRRLKNGPDHFDILVSSLAIGDSLAFAGLPCEPFVDIGRAIKGRSPFRMTVVTCLTNGSEGYIPSTKSHAEGGYESLSSRFAAPTGDCLVDAQLGQLAALKENATAGADGVARPIDVGSRLQVLWDDHVVDAEKTTARRVLHHPEFAGTVMTHDKPWEGDGSDYHCIVPDRDDRGEFLRMYYNGVAIRCGWKDVRDRFSADGVRICYAESWDHGLTWVKPSLGIVEFMGSKENNCILDADSFGKAWDNFMVLKDDNPACPPEERYKGVGKLDGRLWCFLSSDGIRFRKGWPIAVAGAFDSLNVAFWDKARGVYHLYFRGFHKVQSERNGDLNVRDVRHSVSKDFRTWSEPKLLDFGEGAEDYALYTNVIQPYFREPSIFVGFPSRYVERKAWTANYDRLPSPEKRRWRMDKAHGGQPRYGLTTTDCIFVFSRDGQRFFREDDAFMRPGPENPGNWVYGDAYPAYRLIKTPAPFGGDDEISIYAFDQHWSGLASNLNRWRIRQDGFVSRHGTYAGQKVVTKPLVFTGLEMLVNFSTSARGRMFVEIRDASGRAIKSVELFGDKVDRVVDFAADAKLSEFQGRPVVVEFDLSDADIYSFRFNGRL